MSREEQATTFEVSVEPTEPSGDDLHLQINLRLHLEQVAEIEAAELRVASRREPTPRELCLLAGQIYDNRRQRDKIIDRKIFGEPAWDMLLALYCLPKRGVILTVSGLSYSANVAQSTGLRWQKILTREGLIERGPPGSDLRKQMIRLTTEGRSLMDRYLTRLFYCHTPVTPCCQESK